MRPESPYVPAIQCVHHRFPSKPSQSRQAKKQQAEGVGDDLCWASAAEGSDRECKQPERDDQAVYHHEPRFGASVGPLLSGKHMGLARPKRAGHQAASTRVTFKLRHYPTAVWSGDRLASPSSGP